MAKPTALSLDANLRRGLNLANLLGCTNRAQLKESWLLLTEDERRSLRPSKALANHAWSLIIRDRILAPGAAA